MVDKIVIIPDSFKNTMSSDEVCQVIKDKLIRLGCKCPIFTYPIADGGEGTALIYSKYLNLDIYKIKTTNAYNKEIEIEYGSDGEVAVMDIASVVGFDANTGEVLNPQITTTYGIGIVLKKLISLGHKKIYVGLGGSITNDLGLGMASALGVKFYNKLKEEFVPVGKTYKNVYKIDMSSICKFDGEIICLSDVKSPLLGDMGAAKMFSRQKGADDPMVQELEEDAKIFLEVAKCDIGSFEDCEGSGAAGGLGYAFKAFLNAKMCSGIKEVIKISGVSYNIDENTLVVTGEGSFDKQSLNGKVISGILEMVKTKKSRLIIISGVADVVENDNIEKIISCTKKGRKLEEIKKTCYKDLEKATEKLYKYLFKENNKKII